MRRIVTRDDLEADMDALCRAEPRLAAIRGGAGTVPLRLVRPGFASLVAIVVSQQVSRASADAIMGRLRRLVDPMTPAAMVAAGEAAWREAGLSRAKQRTMDALCRTIGQGRLDLDHLCSLAAEDAIAALTAISGIGPWTAEVYLLFAAGHPDVFPAGDVALQSAAGDVFAIEPRPGVKALSKLAESWSPWRGAAARLLWAHYARMRGREAAPVLADAMPSP